MPGLRYWRYGAYVLLLALGACTAEPKKERFGAVTQDYRNLPGWENDDHAEALKTFLISCEVLAARPREATSGNRLKIPGKVWRSLCDEGAKAKGQERAFFERRFKPYLMQNNGKPEGLFTGYYEPLLKGSLTKQGDYIHPVYAAPPELSRQLPYYTRAQIDAGKLAGRRLEIVWVDDPVMLFFMHVQGSGVIKLTNGKLMYLNFAGKNERPYTSIGKVIGEEGLLPKGQIDFFTIREWMRKNPQRAKKVMHKNASYVFFKKRDKAGAIGSVGVPLTPQRSMAVDNAFIPYGLPLFLTTQLPSKQGDDVPFNRLMVAQDTGTAIKGVVRGDIYFGHGGQAEFLAGAMKARGSYYLLLPRELSGQL